MSTSGSGRRAQTRTWVLTATLAVTAGLLASVGARTALFEIGTPRIVTLGAFAVAFLLGEQFLMNVEFRRQAHSFTLAGLPLCLGILIAPVPDLVLARVLGAGVALLIQRISLDKLAYNVAAYAFEAALVGLLAHLLVPPDAQLGLRTAAMVLLAIVACDQLMSGLVLCVITWHGGAMSAREVRDVLLRAAVLAIAVTAMAFGALLLAEAGPLGIAVAVVLALVAFAVYHSYLIATKRHQRVELLHEFVSGSSEARSLMELTRQLLPRIRSLLRATEAEILFWHETDVSAVNSTSVNSLKHVPRQPQPSGRATRITDDGDVQVAIEDLVLDWPAIRAITHAEPLLAARTTKDRAVRGWLDEHEYRDAMLAPIPVASGFVGTVTVAGRLGETSSFTDDDLTLLQTLAGHLAVAFGRAELMERLTYDATHDSLTGLANRAVLSHELDVPQDGESTACVLLLDLNRFKETNDGLGHAAGDQLLRCVAKRMESFLPSTAIVARLGGDEFAALLPNFNGSTDEAQATAQRLAEDLSRPLAVDEAMITPDASIGVALAGPGTPRADLLRQADIAMYIAKTGGTTVALYHPDMDRGRLENLALLADLRMVLREHPEQLAVYYQPKVDMRSKDVVSAEALVRWYHPTLGVLGPDRFIRLAETTGLIDQFTPLVLRAALTECRRWHAAGHQISVAVNLSARNVGDPGLAERISTELQNSQLSPKYLILEITESSIIADPDQSLATLNALAELGVTISLDDFGTGYSSLSYLQRLPVQEIKIDRSFVHGLASTDSHSSRALIASITGLAKNLGLRVVAEGIETENAFDELRSLGCDVAQGYLIARPAPADAFATWLNQHATPAPESIPLTQN